MIITLVQRVLQSFFYQDVPLLGGTIWQYQLPLMFSGIFLITDDVINIVIKLKVDITVLLFYM